MGRGILQAQNLEFKDFTHYKLIKDCFQHYSQKNFKKLYTELLYSLLERNFNVEYIKLLVIIEHLLILSKLESWYLKK